MQENLSTIPSNVPRKLVIDWDLYHPPGGQDDIHLAWKKLHDGPDIVWTPRNGGHWIVTRAEDIDFLQRNHDPFSMREITLPPDSKQIRILPLEADPPEHGDFRLLINTWFTPKSVNAMEPMIRDRAVQLIEDLAPKGECEFISDFALHLPIDIFMHLVHLPAQDRDQLLAWTNESTRADSAEARVKVFEKTQAYLQAVIEERRLEPDDDLFSRIIHGRVFNRELTDEEIMGMCLTVLFGGLDTVASSMGFIARFLAGSPAHRRQLIAEPSVIPQAVDEFLRRFGVSSTTRTLTRDYEFKGLQFKEGDRVYVFPALAGLDERRWEHALQIDFHRGRIIHSTFGAGPHRCPGSFLARTELKVYLEEWLSRIPDFQVKPGHKPVFESGLVNCLHRLPLSWNTRI